MSRSERAQRRMLAALAGLAGLALATSGCGSGARPSQPNLIVLLIDSLRADHLGAYGYERPVSPEIDRLAASGVVFENATATSSWTKPSVATLFTSRLPSEHHAVSFDRHIAKTLPTLAELLREAGYRTVGVSGNFVHVSERGGFDRGFDSWKSYSVRIDEPSQLMWDYEAPSGEHVPLRAPRADEINAALLERLPAPGEGPLFLYAHYMEPHSPYTPSPRHLEALARPGTKRRPPFATNRLLVDLAGGETPVDADELAWLIDLYDAEISAVDEAVGGLLASLRERGDLDDAVVVVLSDHGEEFGEHGGFFHGVTLHHESLAIPLVIHDTRAPDAGGVRRSEPVDLVDVPTTLLALAGAPIPPGMRGRTLLGPVPPAERALVAELHPDPHFERDVRARTHRYSVVRWPLKAIVERDRATRVYRVDEDRGESVALDDGAIATDFLSTVRDLGASLTAMDGVTGEVELDPSVEEGLRALGYAR